MYVLCIHVERKREREREREFVAHTWMNLGIETATHCNTLQHNATHCNTVQHTYGWIVAQRVIAHVRKSHCTHVDES